MNSLQQTCFQNMEQQNMNGISQQIPPHLYEDYVNFLQTKNFPEWKQKIRLANLEINLEDIEVEPDMYMGDLTYHILVKKKIKDPVEDDSDMEVDNDGNEDEEYELIHEFEDETGHYQDYYEIAKQRNLLEFH